jgi:ketosteroid isomerase-like protein
MRASFLILVAVCFSQCNHAADTITTQQFKSAVYTLSQGWNEGNARMAANVFAENAVYEEPPKKQFYKGKQQIFEFFGGDKGFDLPMKMKWHNLSFNEATQVGFGEYTFAMNNQYHGIVVMQFRKGKITHWREYQYSSAIEWKAFAGESRFETE